MGYEFFRTEFNSRRRQFEDRPRPQHRAPFQHQVEMSGALAGRGCFVAQDHKAGHASILSTSWQRPTAGRQDDDLDDQIMPYGALTVVSASTVAPVGVRTLATVART